MKRHCALHLFDDGGDDFAGRAGDQVIRYLVSQRGAFLIDLDNLGPSLLGGNGNGSCRVDDRRSAYRKNHAAGLGFFQRRDLGSPGDGLSKKYDVGFHERRTVGTPGREVLHVEGSPVDDGRALQAGERPVSSVEFDHAPASSSLVKTVHILRDDRGEITHPFQFGQAEVGRIGSCVLDDQEHIFQHQPDSFGIGAEGVDMSKFLGIIFFPEALGPSEVRDAALYGDTCAGKGDRLFRIDDILRCPSNEFVIHGFLLPLTPPRPLPRGERGTVRGTVSVTFVS